MTATDLALPSAPGRPATHWQPESSSYLGSEAHVHPHLRLPAVLGRRWVDDAREVPVDLGVGECELERRDEDVEHGFW